MQKPTRGINYFGHFIGGLFAFLFIISANTANSEGVSKSRAKWTTLLSGQKPSFEVNAGQTDPSVAYLMRGPTYTLFLKQREAILRLRKPTKLPVNSIAKHSTLSLRFVGPAEEVRVRGAEKRPEVSNYFLGNDPKAWVRNAAHFDRVRYEGLYEGIDAVFYARNGQLEFDFEVSPGTDYRLVGLDVSGSDSLRLDDDGNLLIGLKSGDVMLRAPIVYQHIGGKRVEIQSRYTIEQKQRVRFQLAGYDLSRPLVIDPVLVYSTYLGGTSGGVGVDRGADIAADNLGNAYVIGTTDKNDFPTTVGAFRETYTLAAHQAFVSKFDASGALQWSTFLGAEGFLTNGLAIDVDDLGSVYATGVTRGDNFPTTIGAFAETKNPTSLTEAFVSKLSADGSTLEYSTYLGGGVNATTPGTTGWGIAAAANGNIYVVGSTSAEDFPTTVGAFDTLCGPVGVCNNGNTSGDAFLTVLNPSGGGASDLIYSTYLAGGSHANKATDVTVDGSGIAYITGLTRGTTDFPETLGSYSNSLISGQPGGGNAFFMKLNPGGGGSSDLQYATVIGGSSFDQGSSIAIDGVGNVYVIGYTISTTSTNFPVTAGAFQTTHGGPVGGFDAFVAKISPLAAGAADLIWATYLGGNNFDYGLGIGVDSTGHVYAAGVTLSPDFPIVNAIQPVLNSQPTCFFTLSGPVGAPCADAFVTKLSPDGSSAIFSTFIGGSDSDSEITTNSTHTMDVDSSGNVYITGVTFSGDAPESPFPTTAGAFQTSLGLAAGNAFVAKIGAEVVLVAIDIKPGSDPNSINLCSNGTVPIAIFGSSTLDVNDIDTATLRFAEAAVRVVGKKDPHTQCSLEDVNSDGFDDLVCHFVTTDISALDGESTSATLNGELSDNTTIEGTDSVNIVKDTCS